MRRILYILAIALSIAACTEEIDKSNRYTFTGETVADYMLNRSDKYSHFINLLKRANLLGLLSTYGQYTLFLPDNDAVEKFLHEQDSIYQTTKDTPTPVWTGVTSPFFEELGDSMAIEIARTHLIEGNHRTTEFSEGAIEQWNFNDRYLSINYKVDSEQFYLMLNNYSAIISGDNAVENGVIHLIDKAIESNEINLPQTIYSYPFFGIFSEALRATGFADSLQGHIDNEYIIPELTIFSHIPQKRYHKYTAFLEPDEVFNENGIYTLDDLKAFAQKWYGNEDKDNYRSPKNALYKFVAYHFTLGEIPYDKLVAKHDSRHYFHTTYDITDYFESMYGWQLKLVKPLTTTEGRHIFLNYSKRAVPYNVEMRNHLNIRIIELTEFTQLREEYAIFAPLARNGVIHPIDKILIYNEDEFMGNILNERMRFDFFSILHETSSNNIRHVLYNSQCMPHDYFKNLKSHKKDAIYACYRYDRYLGDSFWVEGELDFSIKLPKVPSRTYEIRMSYNISSLSLYSGWNGLVQVYLDGKVCCLPIDACIENGEEIGWVADSETYDEGVENDKLLRNKGWMKAPDSYMLRNTNGTYTTPRNFNTHLRKIITRVFLGEGEHWLRFKGLKDPPHNSYYGVVFDPYFEFDYIELVPLNIINDPTKPEDRM